MIYSLRHDLKIRYIPISLHSILFNVSCLEPCKMSSRDLRPRHFSHSILTNYFPWFFFWKSSWGKNFKQLYSIVLKGVGKTKAKWKKFCTTFLLWCRLNSIIFDGKELTVTGIVTKPLVAVFLSDIRQLFTEMAFKHNGLLRLCDWIWRILSRMINLTYQ